MLEIVIAVEILGLLLSESWRTSSFAWVLFGISVPIAVWLLFRRIIVRILMRTPEPWDGSLKDPRWAPFRFAGWGRDTLTAHLLTTEESSKDLVLYLHGYGSSLGKAEDRCLHLNTLGMNVVGMNFRGHGGCPHRDDWTLLKVMTDVEALLEAIPKQMGVLPERVWLYGHSVGGFLSIRLGAMPSGWWSKRLSGIVLESPASSYPMVIERAIHPNLRFSMPWVRWILRREHERIHPDLSVRYATAQVPYFGLPKVPILVLQAAIDKTLGLRHHALLVDQLEAHSIPFESYVIEGHSHTTSKDSDARRQLLEKWLSPQINGESRGVLV